MRAAEARSAQIRNPEGVTRCFQVSRYKIEPFEAIRARNLLTKDDCRLALLDEVEPVRPEVPLVSSPLSCACRAERLARARSRPSDKTIGPAGGVEHGVPDCDAAEEMGSPKPGKRGWLNVTNILLGNDAARNRAAHEFTGPLRRIGADLVEKGFPRRAGHISAPITGAPIRLSHLAAVHSLRNTAA